jgi:hypothetical protein
MAALDGIAAGKDHWEFVEVPNVGTTTKKSWATVLPLMFFESGGARTARRPKSSRFAQWSEACANLF